MSFPRYPKYKPSGVEWLGEVPAHWEPIRYKNVFREKRFNSGEHLQAGSISFGRVVFKDDEAMKEAYCVLSTCHPMMVSARSIVAALNRLNVRGGCRAPPVFRPRSNKWACLAGVVHPASR